VHFTLKSAMVLHLDTVAPGWFWQFSQKKQQFPVALPTP